MICLQQLIKYCKSINLQKLFNLKLILIFLKTKVKFNYGAIFISNVINVKFMNIITKFNKILSSRHLSILFIL